MIIYRATQSNNDFNVNDILKLSYTILRGVRKRGLTLLLFDNTKRRSILSIKNKDSLCLPRAIVISKDYVLCDKIRTGKLYEFWNYIRDNNGT